jgi:hypothetical protein
MTKYTFDAFNAGLKFIANPTMENAIEASRSDTLSREYNKLLGQIKREIAEKDERIRRLLSACQTWEEKEQLAREALEVACGEIEALIGHDCPLSEITDNVPEDCDNDHGVCLQNYFMQKAQERIDARKNNEQVREEIEGRKKMDGQDIQKEMKGGMNT